MATTSAVANVQDIATEQHGVCCLWSRTVLHISGVYIIRGEDQVCSEPNYFQL